MKSYKVHCIVEYVKQQRDFPFDVFDVRENLDGILFFFGFGVELDSPERWMLQQELEKLAEASEVGESRRLMSRAEVGQWLCLGSERG